MAAAAEGAVLFLEKLSPALCQVDSSTGALGQATHSAIDTLAPIIAGASVTEAVRRKWLERLFAALQDDDPPHLESLGDHWGDLCVSDALASGWIDDLLPALRRANTERKRGTFVWVLGASACYSAMFKVGRYDELLALLDGDRDAIWPYRVWGGRVLLARGKVDEAIAYMAGRKPADAPRMALAAFAEDALLKAGRRAEAYQRYAVDANQANSRLATFRAIAKKYPELDPDQILNDLIQSTPGNEGKWFATAKTLKRFELAAALAWRSPCDPKTLTRAARDHRVSQPKFAVEAALASLHWMSAGHGYDVTVGDARETYQYALDASQSLDHRREISARVNGVLASGGSVAALLSNALKLNADE